MSICTAEFTIEKAFILSAYWTFDEVYGVGYDPATWIDKVQSIPITGFEADSYPTGLYLRGRKALNWGFTEDPKLAYPATAEGFSFWFWIKKDSGAPTNTYFHLESYTDALSPSFDIYVWYASAATTLHVNLSAYSSDADPGETASLDINPPSWLANWNAFGWCLVCVTYTASDKKIRVYTDASGPQVSLNTATMYAMPDANIRFYYSGGSGYPVMDEFGVSMQSVLTDDQVVSLYNGGAGKTWPAVLTP